MPAVKGMGAFHDNGRYRSPVTRARDEGVHARSVNLRTRGEGVGARKAGDGVPGVSSSGTVALGGKCGSLLRRSQAVPGQ